MKFAAKIASDLGKPDGLPRGAAADGVREFLAPLPVSRLWGVGPRTDEQLQRLGLRKIGDVAHADPRIPRGAARVGAAPGCTISPTASTAHVEPTLEAKSVGAEETFEDDLEGEDLHPFIHEQASAWARACGGQE